TSSPQRHPAGTSNQDWHVAEAATKHETVMDVTAEQLARVYGQALWAAALKQGNPPAVVEELKSVVTDVLDRFEKFDTILGSALVDHEQKEKLIDRVFGKQLSPTVLNFLKVLSKHDRLGVLRLVVKETQQLLRTHLGQVDVEVKVAAPLDPKIQEELLATLRARGNREPILNVQIDPEIVGGIIVKIGDRVYDGSLRTRFEMARRAIIERASELIETKPDLFIHAG
ncbi:MAG: ATP synthase F1 subunit delta, partial [Pirellulales bacterium]